MFEVIGYVGVFSFVMLFITFQYSMMFLGAYRKDLNNIEKVIGWIPLLPFILMFLLTLYYLLEMGIKNLHRWFELNWGWFFVNGRKRSWWGEYLREKYGNEKNVK